MTDQPHGVPRSLPDYGDADSPFSTVRGASGTSQRRPFDAVAADPLTGASGQRRHTLYWVSRIHFFSSSRSLYCAAVLRSIEVWPR